MNGAAVPVRDFKSGGSKLFYQYSVSPKSQSTVWHLIYLIAIYIGSVAVIVGFLRYDSTSAFKILLNSCIAFGAVFILNVILAVKREELLIVAPLGLQATTLYCTGKTSSTFIPWCRIHDIIINEAISGCRIVRYLAVITKTTDGKKSLYPLFLNSKPRLAELEQIYVDVQKVLSV